MTKRRFGKRWSFVVAMAVAMATPAFLPARAQQAEPAPKAATLIKSGDVLTGELNVMKLRGGRRASASPPIRSPACRAGCRRQTGCAASRPVRKLFRSSPRAMPRRRS